MPTPLPHTDYSITLSPSLTDKQHVTSTSPLMIALVKKLSSLSSTLIISIETGNNNNLHFQIALQTEPTRQDKLKEKIARIASKFIELTYPTLVVKPHYDFIGLLGYCLKENPTDPYIQGLTQKEIIEIKTKYKKDQLERKIGKDKIRINIRNFHIMVKNHYETNPEFLKARTKDLQIDYQETVIRTVASMLESDYWIGAILLSNKLDYLIDIAAQYLQNGTHQKKVKQVRSYYHACQEHNNT